MNLFSEEILRTMTEIYGPKRMLAVVIDELDKQAQAVEDRLLRDHLQFDRDTLVRAFNAIHR